MLRIFSFHGTTAPSAPGPPHYRGCTITLRHITDSRTPLDEWSARRRGLYLTKKTAPARDTEATGGIRNHNPRKRKAAYPRLRQGGQWDRPSHVYDSGSWPSLKGLHDHTESDTTLWASDQPEADTGQHTTLKQTNIHVSRRIRTHNLGKRTFITAPNKVIKSLLKVLQ